MTTLLDPAPRDPVAGRIARLAPHLAPLTRERLDRLLALIGADCTIVYADACAALFPERAADPAAKTRTDKALKTFRDTLAAIAGEHGVVLTLKVDQRRNADPADRRLWFVTEDDSEERIVRFNEGAIQSLPGPAELQDQYLSVQAESIEPSLLLVYAESERADAEALGAALATQLAAHGCDWPLRDWHAVRVGEALEPTRRVWLQEAFLVLVLTSPALVAALRRGEVRLETGRPLLPLALRQVEPAHLEGTALAGLSVFPRQGEERWPTRAGPRRDAWISKAARQILEWTRTRDRGRARAGPALPDLRDLVAQAPLIRGDDCDDTRYVPQLIRGRADLEGRPAFEFLLKWLRNPQGDVFCAVFGELGLGKTTLCQRLTRVLLDLRTQEPGLPLPIYLDLRAVNTMGWDWTRGAPDLDPLLGHLLATAYNIPEGEPRPDAGQVRELAQRHGGLILLDGLDEVMNRLTPEQCRLFIQRLWSLLPPILWKPPAGLLPDEAREWRRPTGVGRLLMTCRSHFFRTIQDQINALDGQQRESVSRDDYLWVNLLPFTGAQVEGYFRQVFADDPERAGRVIAMLDEVHDLRELGSRPYNLRLIQDQVDWLESFKRDGRRVDVADLYDGLVGQWTRRDDPKHRLSRDHKLLLMERLALRLWSEQSGDLRYTALEDWLADQILADPRWERIDYRAFLDQPGGAEILKEYLRNATFLVREGEDRFRFAHTSIMEFFLARALHRALCEDRPDDWAVPVPSTETLDFLGGLIAARDTATCLAGLARMRARYRPRASEVTLAYALYAHAQGRPGADFVGFQLQGASLRFQRWEGREDRPMDWRGADLSGSELDGGRFIDCDFSGGRFDGADLARTLFDRCRLDGVSARGIDFSGATLHQCPAEDADFTNALVFHSQWLADLPPPVEGIPPLLFTAAVALAPAGSRPGTSAGHRGSVRCIQIDPAGRWLASAGDDDKVRLWNLVSARVLHTLEGSGGGGVGGLAAAPDGRWLASGGDDGRVRLWDPARGRALFTLQGHDAGIRALAVAPDGRWLASGGGDGRVRLWDPASGLALRTLAGHRGEVRALAAAPDGHWLASAGDDGSVRLWDPASGRVLYSMVWHGVRALAAASDGRWLASAGDDGSIRLWDPASRRVLLTLKGHETGILALAAAPDGRWLASAGNDGMVRLWDPESGRALHILRGHPGGVRAVAAAPDGRWMASCGEDGRVRLWDPSRGRALYAMEGHQGGGQALTTAPDGRWLASAGENHGLRVWAPTNEWALHALGDLSGGFRALTAAPDGRWLASGGDDGVVRLWDPASGLALHTLAGHRGGVRALVAAPDGRWLASGGDDGRVHLWNPTSGLALRVLAGHGGGVLALAAAPDGRWLASARMSGWVDLWDPASGRVLHALGEHKGGVWALAVGPDGRWLASAGDDGTVRLWYPAGGHRHVLAGHPTRVLSLAAAPDGRWLASAGSDGNVRLWDPTSGRALHLLDGHQGEVGALAAAPDGRWLAAAGADGWIRFWTLPCEGSRPFCANAIESLPEGNWVVWYDPDGPNRRWVRWSRDAWRWLGWHAPLPDGEHWMFYPMDAFRADSDPDPEPEPEFPE